MYIYQQNVNQSTQSLQIFHFRQNVHNLQFQMLNTDRNDGNVHCPAMKRSIIRIITSIDDRYDARTKFRLVIYVYDSSIYKDIY